MARPLLAPLRLLLLLGTGGLVVACSGSHTGENQPRRSPEEAVHYVHLRMTEDKGVAENALEAAVAWWSQEQGRLPQPDPLAGSSPLEIHWRAPMYRVRLGPFQRRAEAEAVVEAAQSSFPNAFIGRE